MKGLTCQVFCEVFQMKTSECTHKICQLQLPHSNMNQTPLVILSGLFKVSQIYTTSQECFFLFSMTINHPLSSVLNSNNLSKWIRYIHWVRFIRIRREFDFRSIYNMLEKLYFQLSEIRVPVWKIFISVFVVLYCQCVVRRDDGSEDVITLQELILQQQYTKCLCIALALLTATQ